LTLAPHFALGYCENICENSGLSNVDPAPVSDFVEGHALTVVVPGLVPPLPGLDDPPQAARIIMRPSSAADRLVNRCRSDLADYKRRNIMIPCLLLALLRDTKNFISMLRNRMRTSPFPLHRYHSMQRLTMLYGYVKG